MIISTGPDSDLSTDTAFFQLLTRSYQRFVGTPLVDAGAGPDWLYNEAAFAVVAHNTEPDPRFVYGNRAAQEVFGYSWSEFITLPSRLSAKAPEREERQRLLDAVAVHRHVSNYCGLRVRQSGETFWMEDGVIWQLVDDNGTYRGQAATFSRWKAL